MDKYLNESMMEAAIRIMKTKKKPKSLRDLTNEVFLAKQIKGNIEEKKAQFQMDFMLSGHFVCCGENKQGHKLWDLKNRQPTTLLDKDGQFLEDLYADDEDVINNELKDDLIYTAELDKSIDSYIEDDEDDDNDNETDDIEEELGLVGLHDSDEEGATTEIIIDDDDEDEEEIDDIEEELQK